MTTTPISSSDSAVRIRTATKADIPAMVAVVNAAFAVERFIEGTRTDEADIAEMMKKGVFLIAETDAGSILASVYAEVRGLRGYFGMLAVDPSHQGRGLARRMIEAAQEHCRQNGCTHVDITVLSLRTELPAFYHRFGYVETGTHDFDPPHALKPGAECHCIVMSKAL
jgi:ribosomal protein S18 acetylase RimI-like enzyme